MSGITYYKLSKDIYPGDTTKGCGLTGPEIDANFHFLRGYDIKSGDLNPENGVITLYRLNGEKIEIEGLAELLSGLTDFNLDESYYDPSDGTLHLFVNGAEQSAITGFFTYADIHTDCTLEGDGSEENPLKIAKEFIEGIDAEIKEAVDKEKEERQEADSNLNEKIEEETNRATESERALAEAFGQALNAEVQERQQADDNLNQRITEEIGSREALGEALDAEIERAKGKEQELQEAINSEKERAEAAENAEKARAEEKESELQSKIEAETERAKDAESGLTEEIATEKQRATEAEGNLQQEIESEKNRATEKENELDDKINGVKEDLQNAVSSLTDEIASAVSSLTDEIASAVTDLKEEIDTERSERESAVTDLTQAISDTKEELYSAITEEKEERENQIEEIKEDIAELDSAFTESLSEISSEISAITDSINELEEKVEDVTLTEDVVISESSPLYPFISGIWEDNIIPSGTTFTEFVKTLCSGDTRMIYYIDTPLSDIDDVVANFGSMATAITYTNTVTITGTSNNHIVGIALPKPHSPSKIMLTQSGLEQDATGKFFANVPREIVYNGISYTLYYYKVSVGFRSTLRFDVTIA